MPPEITYPLDTLKQFIEHDDNAVVAFYGGEPLLRIETMKRIIQMVNAKHFVLQTNGLHLNEVGSTVHKLDTILVSIDGRKEVNDAYRGEGNYDQVIRNVNWLRHNGYGGELIARMVASVRTDIFRDVTHLLSLNLFDYVHWQIDAIWSTLFSDFPAWVDECYLPSLMPVSYTHLTLPTKA